MRKLVVLCVVLLLSCSALATISDLNPASWRTDPAGQFATTLQGWSFDDGAALTVPELVSNSFGAPTMEIVAGTYMQSYMGRDGVLRYTAAGEIGISIPNSDNTEEGTWKQIWLQVIYSDPYGAGFDIPVVTVPGYDTFERVSSQDLGDGFVLDTYDIIIRPNPTEEELIMFPIQCAMYVDEIVVDTICVPEPATLLVLSLGGLVALRRRK